MRISIVRLLAVAAGTIMFSNSALAAEPSKTAPQPQKHVVVAGESLSTIATGKNLESWMPLWNANPQLANPDQVNPGDELVVPTEPVAERPLPAGYGQPVAVPIVRSTGSTGYVQSPARVRASSPAPSGDVFARIRARESGGNHSPCS